MSDAGASYLAQHRALDGYFEALLGDEGARECAVPPLPDPSSGAAPGTAPSVGSDGTSPDWAGPRFDALLFRVNGLKLAVPASKVVGVEPYPRALAPALRQWPWLLGRFRTGAGEATLVDLSRIVIPARYRLAGPAAGPGVRVILFGGGAWAFACDETVETMTLEADQVRWATGRGTRPWLAGTVMAHACGLLDLVALAAQVQTGEGGQLA